jgi:hypothetical protein
MALKKEAIEKIAKLTKIKTADLEAALKDEKEVDVTIPEDITTFTNDELESRDQAQKKLGEKDGREIGIKEVKKAAGLPEEAPSKDPVKVAQAIIDKATTDAKVKPDEKVTQLTEQVNLLQKQLGEKDNEVTQHKTAAQQEALNRKILTAFPKERASHLNEDEYLTLLKGQYQFKEVDGAIIVEKDGKPLRDPKTTNPLPLTDAVKSIFTERKWVEEGGAGGAGGRGGAGSSGSGKPTKLSDLKAKFTAEGKNLNGEEFSKAVMAAVKEDKDFDMNG